MLPILELEANFFKRHNHTSSKVGLSLKWPYIKNIRTRFDPLVSSTFDARYNIVKAEVK